MRRRILTALAVVSMLMVVMPAQAVLAVNGSCVSPGGSNFHEGEYQSSPNVDRSGARASVKVSGGGFEICDTTPTDLDDNGSFAYVSLEPRFTCDAFPNCILQVGVAECAAFGYEACDGNGNQTFWWAYGGCNGYWPRPRDLGAVPNPSLYQDLAIYDSGDGWYRIWINGTVRASISKTDAGIGCWVNDPTPGDTVMAGYFTERWDIGDSIGNSGDKTYFSNMRYGLLNQGWQDPLFPNVTCANLESDSSCELYSSDNMKVYTVN